MDEGASSSSGGERREASSRGAGQLPGFASELVDRIRTAGNVWTLPGGEIRLPATFGLCRGVRRALTMLEEAVAALKEGDKTAYQVAPHITWKIEAKEWKDFPIVQQWFAMGETIAHLVYLLERGKVRKYNEDGLVYYTPA